MTGVVAGSGAGVVGGVEPPADLVARLAGIDVVACSDAGVVERLVELERAQAWLVALQHEALLELARRPLTPVRRGLRPGGPGRGGGGGA